METNEFFARLLKPFPVRTRWEKIYSLVFGVFLFLVVFLMGMNAPFDHDEQQFIAGARLFSSQSLLPYVDFPFYQVPNILLPYGILFKFTDYLLAGARTFSVVCAWLTLMIIYSTSLRLLNDKNMLLKLAIASLAVFFVVSNPVFIYTCGKAWNHDFPLMLSMVSFVLLIRAIKKNTPALAFLIGFLTGFAAGSRISFAPVAVPCLFCMVAFHKNTAIKERLRYSGLFILGLITANIPSLIMLVSCPGQFIFDVFNYHLRIDIQYLKSVGWYMPMNGRFQYFCRVITEPRNCILTLAGVVFILLNGIFCGAGNNKPRQPNLFLLVIPFLLLGSFSKPVVFYQYLYAPVPFIVLGAIYGISVLNDRLQLRFMLLFILLAGISVYSGEKYFWKMNKLCDPREWTSIGCHRLGCKITKIAGPGKILTLSPILVLEGGGQIYPEFSSSPFTWRTAVYTDEPDRKKMKIISPSGLDKFLESDPPVAILTGFEDRLDDDFIQWSRNHGYEEVQRRGITLMLKRK
jgi:hypothetical protein